MNKLKKRRLKNKIMNNKVKFIVIIACIFILTLGSAYAVLNQVFNISGKATIGNENTICENNISGELIFNTNWGNNDGTQTFNTSLKIKNNSAEDIVGWTVMIKGPSDLTVQSNANITVDEDGIITLTNYDWNGTITPDIEFSLEIGFITVETELNLEYVTFNGCVIHGDGAPDIEPEEPDPDVELTGLTVSPSEYTMSIGEVVTMQATKTPSNAAATIIWTSSNSNVASISDDGIVTAISNGTTTITATSGNITATATITVEEETPPPSTSDVQVVFKNNDNYWQNGDGTWSMNFSVTITNNSSNTIDKTMFSLVMPEGTTYSIWHDAVTVSGNDFVYAYQLENGATQTIYGQLIWPSDVNPDDYISPQIINVVGTGSAESTSSNTFKITNPSKISAEDVEITFNKSGDYWGDSANGYHMNFDIVIKNNSTLTLKSAEFTLDAPSDTTYSIWNNGVTVNNNVFKYSNQLASGGSVKISGQLNYPAGTNINSYISPQILNKIVN